MPSGFEYKDGKLYKDGQTSSLRDIQEAQDLEHGILERLKSSGKTAGTVEEAAAVSRARANHMREVLDSLVDDKLKP